MTRTTKIVVLASILSLLGIGASGIVAVLIFSTAFTRPGAPIEYPTPTPTPFPISETTRLRIDEILEQMDLGNIAFNAPTKMKLNAPSTIQLVLSPTNSIEELKDLVIAEGEKEGARIRVSDQMEARLSGTAFQISAITPELQAVTWNDITEWKWEVRPTQGGRHNLHLTMTAVLTAKGSSMQRALRTFDKTIEVEVSNWQRVFVVFRENWEWMWTLLALPIGGWLLRKRQLNKSNPTQVKRRAKKHRRK